MRRVVASCYKQSEENLNSKYKVNVKNLKGITSQRYILFRSILFSVIRKHVMRLKSNTVAEPELVKTLMALHNNMLTEINGRFSNTKFKDFVLEEIRNKTFDNIFQKAPYADLVNRLQCPSRLEEANYNKPCKRLVGLPCFIVRHVTKSKKELSINVLSDTYTASGAIQFKDISSLIFTKNSFIRDELEYLVKYHLKESYENFAKDKNEDEIFYGFMGSITVSNQENIYDTFDMIYYPEKNFLPRIKLFYSVFQYKKESKTFYYEEIEPITSLNYISIVSNEPFTTEDIPCLFLKKGKIVLGIKDGESKVMKRYFNEDGKFMLDVGGYNITTSSKQILYDYILPNENLILYNKNNILSKFLVYDLDKLYSNEIFTYIREHYILSNNMIVKEIKADNIIGLDTFYRLTANSIPWNKLHMFYQQMEEKEEDIVKLLLSFKDYSPEDYEVITERFLSSSFSSIFNDLYLNDNIRREKLLKMLEKGTNIQDCVFNVDEELYNLCPEFFYILKAFFRLVKLIR